MKSVMHDKKNRTCYLCGLLNGDYGARDNLQEHHAIPGTANRRLSERYGLKVYLCLEHHTAGPMAVHNNQEVMGLVKRKAQEVFEKAHSHEEWMAAFGKNYL